MRGHDTIYRGYRLFVVAQPGGGYQVHIARPEEDKPLLTMKFAELADAMDEARRIVDRVHL